jgi:sporulation protein YlmC with PRC-barrel domain
MKSASNKKKDTLTVCIAIGLVAGGVLGASAQQQQNRSADRPTIGQQEQPGQQQRQQPGQRLGVKSDSLQPGMQQGKSQQQGQSMARASKLLDKEVHGPDGQKLGDVDEIILSQDRRRVEHIKVSLDAGESLMLSLNEVSAKQDDDSALQVRASKQDLQQRQTQNRDQARVGREQDDQESRWVSKLIGLDMQGADGEDVGSINDLIIDTQSGRIETAAVEVGGILGVGARLVSVEWQQVNFAADGDTASIQMTKDQLSDRAENRDEYWKRHTFEGAKGQRDRGLQQPGQRQNMPGARVPRADDKIQGQDDTSSVSN